MDKLTKLLLENNLELNETKKASDLMSGEHKDVAEHAMKNHKFRYEGFYPAGKARISGYAKVAYHKDKFVPKTLHLKKGGFEHDQRILIREIDPKKNYNGNVHKYSFQTSKHTPGKVPNREYHEFHSNDPEEFKKHLDKYNEKETYNEGYNKEPLNIEPKVGHKFKHSRILDPNDFKSPAEHIVTKIAKGAIYYKPTSGGHSDVTPIEDFHKVIKDGKLY